MAMETLAKWIIAVAVLVIVVIGMISQRDKMLTALQKLSEILRFR